MRCRMCVKQAKGSSISEADLPLEVFRQLVTSLPHANGLILNGIGEPLLHPDLLEMVAFARRNMPAHASIGFQSNGLLMDDRLAQELVAAGLDVVCLSVDAVERHEAGWLHGTGHLKQISHVMKLLAMAGQSSPRPLHIGVEFVLMQGNMEQLPNVIRWAAHHGAMFVLVSQMLPYEGDAAAQSLFNPNTKQATLLFKVWKTKARDQGLDIHDYFKVLWKYKKSEAERKVVNIVLDMQTQADNLGIGLNIRGLLQWDKGEDREMDGVLAEAKQIALELGIRLELPAEHALLDGRCRFMEQQTTFIDVYGNVAPCHFLWHRYACHLNGATKQVWPRHFGNISMERLEDIWCKREYQEFRAEVLACGFPSCSNCNVVPCSDILCDDSPFVSDCLGSGIPCGHCPWSMGMLKCLELPNGLAAESIVQTEASPCESEGERKLWQKQ